jgi:hypothetical protein
VRGREIAGPNEAYLSAQTTLDGIFVNL